jgi:hypothetical protein
MTFSEFGRRIISNFSSGTDHGSAAPLFLFGNKVLPGILGDNPQISGSISVNDNLPMQYDFRSVYASVLQDWFCVPQNTVDSTILLRNFQSLPLVDSAACNPTSIHEINNRAGIRLIRNYPNPFVEKTKIEFTTAGGHTLVQVFSGEGQLVKNLIDEDMKQGNYVVDFYNENYAAGLYYARFQNGVISQVASMVLTK